MSMIAKTLGLYSAGFGRFWSILGYHLLSMTSHAFAHPPPRPQSAWHPVFSCKSAEIKNRRSRCRLMEHVTLRQPCWRAISIGEGGGGAGGRTNMCCHHAVTHNFFLKQ